jgi:Trk K+ transport system NAD-binding subunit
LNALERLTAETLYENSTSKFKIVMATIPLNGSIIGKNVNELDLPGDCKLSSILRNGTVLFPQKSFVFKGGDKVLLLGVRNSVEKITEKLKAIEVT